MSSSSKLFFISVLFILISGLLFFQGVREQFFSVDRAVDSTIVQNAQIAVSPSVGVETNVASESSAVLAANDVQKYLVVKVVDGDTIDVMIEGKEYAVRFVGIDTPETVDPRRPVGCFGKEASNETKRLLTGKYVMLEKDVSDSDKYNRLLRYIYLPMENGQTLFVNDYLVREGFAKAYTYPPDVKFNEQFVAVQRVAQEEKKGLWGKCN